MSFLDRLNEVRKNNQLKEDELKHQIELLKQKILEAKMEKPVEKPKEKPVKKTVKKTVEKVIQRKEDIKITCDNFMIFITNIKNNTSSLHKIYCNGEEYYSYINPFQLLVSDSIIYTNNYKELKYKPTFVFDNNLVSCYKVDDTIVIKYKYIYDKQYINCQTELTDLGFDYIITLCDALYEKLYYYENEYGKFRIDLEIEMI